jgi:hypothetical protein
MQIFKRLTFALTVLRESFGSNASHASDSEAPIPASGGGWAAIDAQGNRLSAGSYPWHLLPRVDASHSPDRAARAAEFLASRGGVAPDPRPVSVKEAIADHLREFGR